MELIRIYFIIFLLILLIFFNILITTILLLFLIFDIKNKAFFAPSDRKLVKKFFESFPFDKGKIFYDLGSGDGRIVFEAAKKGLKAIGIENNPWLYLMCRLKKKLLKIDNAFFVRGDFTKISFNDADYIYLYLLPSVLDELEEKIFRSVKKGTIIISFAFPFSHHRPQRVFLNKFFIYQV